MEAKDPSFLEAHSTDTFGDWFSQRLPLPRDLSSVLPHVGLVGTESGAAGRLLPLT